MTDMARLLLAEEFNAQPIAVCPSRADWLKAMIECAQYSSDDISAFYGPRNDEDDFWAEERSWMRPYHVDENGVMHLPVRGSLSKAFTGSLPFLTGYPYIERAFERAMNDANVKGVALVINSGGGAVAGLFELVERMVDLKNKPVRAFAADFAYSAAYAIATVGDTLNVARSGGVGSVGVVTMHVDISKWLEQIGDKITLIYSGRHKVDGNPYEPLPDDVRARIQSRIDEVYDEFVALVARNRGMSEDDVRASEALTFTAREATSNGFADTVGSLDDAVAAFAADLSSDQEEVEPMSGQKDNAAAEQAADVEARITAAKEEGRQAGLSDGAKAERERIEGILALDEAQSRRDSAIHISLKTDLDVESAKGLLASLPEQKAEQPASEPAEKKDDAPSAESHFDAAMKKGNPDLAAGDGSGDGDGASKPEDKVKSILADVKAETGYAPKSADTRH